MKNFILILMKIILTCIINLVPIYGYSQELTKEKIQKRLIYFENRKDRLSDDRFLLNDELSEIEIEREKLKGGMRKLQEVDIPKLEKDDLEAEKNLQTALANLMKLEKSTAKSERNSFYENLRFAHLSEVESFKVRKIEVKRIIDLANNELIAHYPKLTRLQKSKWKLMLKLKSINNKIEKLDQLIDEYEKLSYGYGIRPTIPIAERMSAPEEVAKSSGQTGLNDNQRKLMGKFFNFVLKSKQMGDNHESCRPTPDETGT